MRVRITHKGRTKAGDTISVFDNDGREIAIRRGQIKKLRKKLKDAESKSGGKG